jgi:hypothetical protein
MNWIQELLPDDVDANLPRGRWLLLLTSEGIANPSNAKQLTR